MSQTQQRPVFANKQNIRTRIRQAFAGYTTSYNETSSPTVTTGTLTIGQASISMECKRGQERYLRAEILKTAKEAHEKAMELIKTP